MKMIKTFDMKPIDQLHPGELFAGDWHGYMLAIAMQRHPERSLLTCVLLKSALEVQHPCYVIIPTDAYAMSYGTDWCLDVHDGGLTYPGDYNELDKPGTILMSDSETLLRASGTGDARSRAAHFDLESFRLVSRSPDLYSSVCIREWSIWTSEAEKTRRGGTPIFQFQ